MTNETRGLKHFLFRQYTSTSMSVSIQAGKLRNISVFKRNFSYFISSYFISLYFIRKFSNFFLHRATCIRKTELYRQQLVHNRLVKNTNSTKHLNDHQFSSNSATISFILAQMPKISQYLRRIYE